MLVANRRWCNCAWSVFRLGGLCRDGLPAKSGRTDEPRSGESRCPNLGSAKAVSQMRVAMRPKVSFDSRNIWRRLETCEIVAQAHGWPPNDIISFTKEVPEAVFYQDRVAIIKHDFDVINGTC